MSLRSEISKIISGDPYLARVELVTLLTVLENMYSDDTEDNRGALVKVLTKDG